MSGTPTLALVLSPRVDAGVMEFVRICTGFVGGGGALTLLEVGAGRGVLAGGGLPGDLERSLEGLASFGTHPWAPSADELLDLLRVSARVLRVADPARSGEPALLVLDDDYLASVAPEQLVADLGSAGQVLRP